MNCIPSGEDALLPNADERKNKIGDSPVSPAHGPAVRQPRVLLPAKPTGTKGVTSSNTLTLGRNTVTSSDGIPPLPCRCIPDRSILGAFVLADLFKQACPLPFCAAVSMLEGVHQLIDQQPDLREFDAALVLIVEGERKLLELRGDLAGTDEEFEAACEAPFVAAIPLVGSMVCRMVQLVPEFAEYGEAHARIERGAAIMTALSSYLDSL